MDRNIRNKIARHVLADEASRKSPSRGRPRLLTTSQALEVCFFICRTGCQWSAVDGMFGVSYKTAYHRFNLWSKHRLFEHAFYELAAEYRRNHSNLPLLVDTSHVKNVLGKDVLGPNHADRGRNSTKVSLLCDSLAHPLTLTFHKGNRNDSLTLPHLLAETVRRYGNIDSHHCLYADKGYDSKTCRLACEMHGLEAQIPHRGTTTKWGGVRIRVEHVFGRMDKFRRIILRYDSKIRNFKSFTYMACCTMI